MQAFNAFSTSNAAVLSKLKLDKDACVLKMRLLSLCSLASRQDSISYADIAACLQVPSPHPLLVWACPAGALAYWAVSTLSKVCRPATTGD